jgi:hypothetical protein
MEPYGAGQTFSPGNSDDLQRRSIAMNGHITNTGKATVFRGGVKDLFRKSRGQKVARVSTESHQKQAKEKQIHQSLCVHKF